MRGRYKRNQPRDGCDDTVDVGLSPLQEGNATGLALPDVRPSKTYSGKKRSICKDDKVYLGVRVKMPVRDLLRNKRLAQGWEPEDIQETYSKTIKGDKKRVKTVGCRTKKKWPTKSLEELAIIVEVLEEDLRTSNTYHLPDQNMSPQLSPTGYNSDESDETIPSPQSYTMDSLGAMEYQEAPSPPGFMPQSHQLYSVTDMKGDSEGWDDWFDCQSDSWNPNSSAFFWTQLQREENQLSNISDAALLTTDEHGRTALHKVACVGKRALGFAIGRKMAALNSLDVKDSDGMTSLLHAANHNHHLMVADLISLGANVNATNNLGKSCLHLSAEKGYTRVLEVLKRAMMDGVYVDVEATDNCGMSVLQCAAVALKDTVRVLESSRSASHTRLYTLRQEQMLETLECLLYMGSYLHTMGAWGLQPHLG